jgi:hypothetical protein
MSADDTAITRDITIEELVERVPRAIPYLMRQRIRCLPCGEPLWGTLEEAARGKGYDDEAIDRFVAEINQLARDDRD